MNLAATYYPIFYGHYGPLSEEGKVTLFGIFIILNVTFVITLLIKSIPYLRADKKERQGLGENYWDFLFFEGGIFSGMILMLGTLIDGLAILVFLGEKVGNAIL